VTPEELRERTTGWFVEDDQDQPEIPLEPFEGRTGAMVTFLRSHGGRLEPDRTVWNGRDDVPQVSFANVGEAIDAGRVEWSVLGLHGVRFGGVALPEICVHPGCLFWSCGAEWDSAEVVAAFFDLLGALERECDVRLAFIDEDQRVELGPSFEAIYREWHAR
jgi:hypothetical protein